MAVSRIPKPMSGRAMTGILQVPIDRPPVLLLATLASGTPEEVRASINDMAAEYVGAQEAERVLALAKHYGVDARADGFERELLFKVCEDFIMGFQEAQSVGNTGAGRPKTSTRDKSFDLLVAVRDLVADGKHTVLSACKLLKTRQKEKWRGENPKSMSQKFYRAETSFLRIFEDRRQHPLYKKILALTAPHKPDSLPKPLRRKKGKSAR